MRYKEVMGFLEENHRNPSWHRIEEYDYLNWLKVNRKVLNAGTLKPVRMVVEELKERRCMKTDG